MHRSGGPGSDPDGTINTGPNGNAPRPVTLARDPVPRGWAAGGGAAPGWTAPRWARADGPVNDGAAGPPGPGSRDDGAGGSWQQRLAAVADFARRQVTGEGEVDEFGFDPEFNSRLLIPLARVLYQQWFRVQLRGLEHVPASGPALLVANHSGVLPFDAIMLQTGLHDEHPAHRDLRLLGADLVYEVPGLAYLARRAGHIRACPANAHTLLADGELVGVFPEGFKGIGKPFSERYQLRRFGRGGFTVSAIRAGVPIIPCAIVGAEEIYPMLANAGPLARLLGLPYFPVTPLFPWLGPVGAVPLPSRWIIEFCPPVPTAGYPAVAWRDAAVIDRLTEQVRGTVQQALDRLLDERGPAFG
ncbi:MAG: lysophospholipid acyltransferase family protein [Streptosporangiales bacterium]